MRPDIWIGLSQILLSKVLYDNLGAFLKGNS